MFRKALRLSGFCDSAIFIERLRSSVIASSQEENLMEATNTHRNSARSARAERISGYTSLIRGKLMSLSRRQGMHMKTLGSRSSSAVWYLSLCFSPSPDLDSRKPELAPHAPVQDSQQLNKNRRTSLPYMRPLLTAFALYHINVVLNPV